MNTVHLSRAAAYDMQTILSLCSEIHKQQVLDILVGVCPLGGRGTFNPVNKASLPSENKRTVVLHITEI